MPRQVAESLLAAVFVADGIVLLLGVPDTYLTYRLLSPDCYARTYSSKPAHRQTAT